MISYLGLTMVWVFTYKQIECKNNKSLFWFIGQLMIKKMHGSLERLNYRTMLLTFSLWYLYYHLKMNRS